MSPTTLTYIAADLITLAVPVGILYAPRHSRKDLMAACIGINVGILAVTLLLSTMNVTAGLGLGLFSVLSIIRLCSIGLTQYEVAYFFVAPTPGLFGGTQTTPTEVVAAPMGTVVATLWIGDHPTLIHRNHYQVIVFDYAITSETALIAHLGRTLDGQVGSVKAQRLDLVDDTTIADVRFRTPHHTPAEFETAAALDDITPAVQFATEPTGTVTREVQTTQPWNGTCLNAVQAGPHPESVEAQPLTMAPAAQHVTRSNSQAAPSAAVASR